MKQPWGATGLDGDGDGSGAALPCLTQGIRLVTLLALLALLVFAPGVRAASRLRPVDPRCEGAVDPCGVDEPRPELSWRLESGGRGARQTAFQVLVARTPETLKRGTGELWDSGRVGSEETVHIPYGGRLLGSSERVHWKVRVWDEGGEVSEWSQPATWVTGVMAPGDWKARWITADFERGLPVMRQEFVTTQAVKHAILHVSGLGHYELFLDGARVGDRFLDPAWTVYERTANYASYDLTAALREPGRHVLGLMLGKGFYRTAGDRRIHGVKSERPLKALLQARLILVDGSEQWVVTDGSWRFAEGPITHSAILGGEDFDARRLSGNWAAPGFDASSWSKVTETQGPGGSLRSGVAPPMRWRQEFKPVRIDEPEPGRYVYDFGQNASAVPRLRIRGPAGRVVRLTPAEQRFGMTPRRNDGRGLVNPAGVGSPSHFEYTLRGGAEETWMPQFTYTGFQYLQVEGAVPAGQPNPEGRPVIEELVSVHVRSGAEEVGEFECSNPRFNDIDRLVSWAVRGNLAHVLTDCPHREKLGWLEVAYLMGPSMAGRHDLGRFFAKIAGDCSDSQGADGSIPTVAPAYPAFSGGFAFTPEWGAAAVVVPWLAHEWYGDRRTLERSFPMMRGYVEHLRSTSRDLVPVPGLGDWYDYGHGKPVGASQFTPPELSAMATFHRCTRIVAEAARVLGRSDDAAQYAGLADRIAGAFHARWFDGRNSYRNLGSPQTANAMALVSGIVPADKAADVFEAVVTDLKGRNLQQTSGDIGHWYLLQALATRGRSDLIHAMTVRTNLGSYGFIVNNGWTSMPEAWDANTGASMNHCMLGHIQEWFLGWVAGIRPDPEAPGFRSFIVAPQLVGDLTWARGRYASLRGPIQVRWESMKGGLTLDLEVPPNTSALVVLPAAKDDRITEGGGDAAKAEGVERQAAPAGEARFRVGGGHYRFELRGE